MQHTRFNVSVSDIVIRDKNNISYKEIWKTMQPVSLTLNRLRQSIIDGHPFLCCKRKNEWDGQRLFCVDIDHFEEAEGKYTFIEFIKVLDVLCIPPCMAYTTFNNPEGKMNRFRLLFQMSEPVDILSEAEKISRFLCTLIDELVPHAPDKKCFVPYQMFYPGKEIVLYRPDKFVRLDIISETIHGLERPYIVIDTRRIWNRMKKILERDPYIPSVKFRHSSPNLLIVMNESFFEVIECRSDICISLDALELGYLDTHGLYYNIIYLIAIIDKYYINIQRAHEQSNLKIRNRSTTVFEHYEPLLSELLCGLTKKKKRFSDEKKALFLKHKNAIYEAMGIQVEQNTPMALPVRYARYAKALQNLSDYPNLRKIFRRDPRKSMVLISLILLVRDMASALKFSSGTSEQYIVTHKAILDKLAKKFKQYVSENTLTKWLRQFSDLELIHLCDETEIVDALKNDRQKNRRPTVVQIPYFDKSVLIHADNRAAAYEPSIGKTDDDNYVAVFNIVNLQLSTKGWFSRTSFIHCVQQEEALNNLDGLTAKKAGTCFDKHIGQISRILNLIKSPCTKELMARFPGNHKMGLTRIYYRKETDNDRNYNRTT